MEGYVEVMPSGEVCGTCAEFGPYTNAERVDAMATLENVEVGWTIGLIIDTPERATRTFYSATHEDSDYDGPMGGESGQTEYDTAQECANMLDALEVLPGWVPVLVIEEE